MRSSTNLAAALALAGLSIASLSWVGCAKSASDCALLGLPAGCSTGTGGEATNSTTTSSTSVTTISAAGGGGSGGASTTMMTGGGGSGGATTTMMTGGGGSGGSTTTTTPTTEFLPLCARKFWGDASDQAVRGVATDALGTTIAGDFKGQLDLGLGALAAGPSGSMFVARLGASLAPTWNHAYDATFGAIAATPSGHVVIAGTLGGPVDFGCGSTLDPLTGGFFIAELDAVGACVYARNYVANVTRLSLAIDLSGNAVLAGGVTGTTAFGSAIPANGGEDIFVAAFNSAGLLAKVRTVGSSGDDRAVSVAVDQGGEIYVTGTFEGTLNFTSGDGDFTPPAGHVGAFVAGFNTSITADWSRHLASANDVEAVGVVPLPSNGVAVAVGVTAPANLGAGMVSPASGKGILVARYSAAGIPSGSTPIDGLSPGDGSAMAVSAVGEIAVAGSAASGLFLARFDPAGTLAFQGRATGTGAHHRAASVAYLPPDKLLLGGFFDGTLATTPGTVDMSKGGDDAVVMQICTAP